MLKVGNIVGECLFFIFLFMMYIDKLEKEVGFGASGKIFKATHIRTKQIKAIKAVPILDESTYSKLSSDLQIGMELSRICPYLVEYYNVFKEGNFQIIVMDYYENGDLETFIEKKTLAEKDIIRLIRQITTALNTLHERNIIHRDLKMRNILVDKDFNFKLSLIFLYSNFFYLFYPHIKL
jgi:serine/threonine-protein kinase